MVDLAPFVVFEVDGPGAKDYLQYLTVNNVDVAVGKSVYTPLLDVNGGFRSDLTMLRIAENTYRVMTGAFDGPRDAFWFRKHLPADGWVHFTDLTSAYATIGVWGPKARAVMGSLTESDVVANDAAAPSPTSATLELVLVMIIGLGLGVFVISSGLKPE